MKVYFKKFIRIMSVSLQKLKKRTPPESERKTSKKMNRFDGLTEDEIKKNTLKDILELDLDLVFVGINPSLMAAHTGRYYAGPGNHFYKLLFASKLIPVPITYEEDDRLLQYKIGLTNIVERATRSSADLSRSEIKRGAMLVQDKLKRFKPKVAIFNGKCIYEEFDDKYDKSSFKFGLQPHKVGGTALWVVPSSSARCANFPRMEDKLHFYTSLKTYLAYLKGEIKEVNLDEFRFEGRCKQAIPSTSKMWRRKGLSAFAGGGRVVNKETICMDTSEENILAVPKSSEFIVTSPNKKESDFEKDSGISASQSENSQETYQENETETNENNAALQNNSRPKRQANRKVSERKMQTRSTVIAQHKERAQTIDFVSLIKQRLSQKEESTNDNDEENDCKEDESLSPNTKLKRLKYSNLDPKKPKRNFKVKTDQ